MINFIDGYSKSSTCMVDYDGVLMDLEQLQQLTFELALSIFFSYFNKRREKT